MTSPHPLRSLKTWWTVEARAPDPEARVDPTQQRALSLLIQLSGMHLAEAWKSLQLGVLTIWNICRYGLLIRYLQACLGLVSC